jgi:hypothetical protein
MTFTKISGLAALFLSLASCSTSYQAAGFGGGYSEIITSSDSYFVTFRGNSYTTDETVMKYALMRASELALENGYRYFTVLSSTDQTRSVNYVNTQENTSSAATTSSYSKSSKKSSVQESSSFSTYSGVIRKPGLTLQVKCFREKPEILDVIDAEYYLVKNKE